MSEPTDPGFNPLLAPAAAPQRHLLHIAATVAADTGSWPIFQYVEAALDEVGHDAADVLASMPIVQGHGHLHYSWSRRGLITPSPEVPIALTIAGLAQLPEFADTVDAFVRVVAELGIRRLNASYDPHAVVEVVVHGPDLLRALGIEDVPLMNLLPELLQSEPATWHGGQGTEGNEWVYKPAAFIRQYRDVRTAEEYLDRVFAWIAPVVAPPEPTLPSPLGLAAAFDYLNVVWRLRFGKQLVHLPGAERTTRLAFDAQTPEEFDNRLSALVEMIKGLAVPGDAGGPSQRLQTFLRLHLEDDAMARVDHAASTLHAVTQVRNAGQHVDASARAARALAKLGLEYPLRQPVSDWRRIQTKVIEALDAIRDEIRLPQPSSQGS
ncbi:hypothetical protein ABZ777_12255 [Micromonospora parva]|uniref:hypothetical protein n=1 Tax=Micromonospora parva TaxID=1464048 RepID=UPI003410E8C4